MSKYIFDTDTIIPILIKDKKNLLKYIGAGAVAGIVVAFSIPRIYKSSVMLAPETANNNITGSISSLASMVGMNMGGNMTNDAIYPEIYPELMGSTEFTVGLFDIKVKTKDGKINTTYYDYINRHKKITWWSYPALWLGKLFEKKEPADGKGTGKVDPFMLTKRQTGTVKEIKNNIECRVDKKTSVITIDVTAQDPLVAATLADSVRCRLQDFITAYRTNKSRNDLKYMEKLYEESKAQYVKARQKYAVFSDANQDPILESIKSKTEDLENEMQLQYNIYTQVTQQLQAAKAKVQENTPAFTTLQTATVPVRHSNTPKIFILAIWVILASLLRVSMLIWKNRNLIIRERN